MKKDLQYHLINSGIAGALVFLGAFTASNYSISMRSMVVALATSGIVALTKFSNYLNTKDPCTKKKLHLIAFVGS